MKKFLLFFAFLIMLLVSSGYASADTWWNASWTYSRQINISNNAGSVLETGYSVNFSLNHFALVTDGKSNQDGSDIRIIYSNVSGNYSLDWVNTTNFNNALQNVTIWFKLQQNISANNFDANYTLYYGNPNASSPPQNRSNVFMREIDGAKASWHLDEGSGTSVSDDSGSGNNGTVGIGGTWVDGKFGKALQFDGANTNVDFGDTANLSALPAMSASFWLKTPGQGGTVVPLVTKYQGSPLLREWFIAFITSTNLRFAIYDNSAGAYIFRDDINSTVTDNNWHFMTFTWTGGTTPSSIAIYTDNVQVDDTSGSSGTFVNVDDTDAKSMLSAGEYTDGTFQNLNGVLDEIFIFNKSLTTDEISDLYSNYGSTFLSYPSKVFVRKYQLPEPIAILGSEQAIDITPPSITIYSPQNITYSVGTTSIALNVSANETISAWLYSLNGSANTTFTPNTTISGLGAGSNQWVTVWANDTANNFNSSTVYFTINASAPSGNVTPTFSLDNDTGVFIHLDFPCLQDGCEIKIDSGVQYFYNISIDGVLVHQGFNTSTIRYHPENLSLGWHNFSINWSNATTLIGNRTKQFKIVAKSYFSPIGSFIMPSVENSSMMQVPYLILAVISGLFFFLYINLTKIEKISLHARYLALMFFFLGFINLLIMVGALFFIPTATTSAITTYDEVGIKTSSAEIIVPNLSTSFRDFLSSYLWIMGTILFVVMIITIWIAMRTIMQVNEYEQEKI